MAFGQAMGSPLTTSEVLPSRLWAKHQARYFPRPLASKWWPLQALLEGACS